MAWYGSRLRILLRKPSVWFAAIVAGGVGVLAINVVEGAPGVVVAVAFMFIAAGWVNIFGPGRDI
jgi:hypothetical protein